MWYPRTSQNPRLFCAENSRPRSHFALFHAEPWAEERYSYQEGPRAELEP